ncbi:hypothetical protein [Flavobacterium sp.]|uniref:hypothetical protein n=1 Tax=Flavobacterium sp. TaxID=239 RepID=UPI002639A637|nr:hypothetical protein [Flavobacterium sp.]
MEPVPSAVVVGSTLQLDVQELNGYTYQWTGPMGFDSELRNPIVDNFTVDKWGAYTVTITNGTCINEGSVEAAVLCAAQHSINGYPITGLSPSGTQIYFSGPFDPYGSNFWNYGSITFLSSSGMTADSTIPGSYEIGEDVNISLFVASVYRRALSGTVYIHKNNTTNKMIIDFCGLPSGINAPGGPGPMPYTPADPIYGNIEVTLP